MSLGCRNISLLALVILLTIDAVFEWVAVPSVNAGVERKVEPVFRQKRSAISEPDVIFKKSSLSKSQVFQKLQINNYDLKTVDYQGNCIKSYYTYTSPPGTRIKLVWKQFNIIDNQNDYITAYSGDLSEYFYTNDEVRYKQGLNADGSSDQIDFDPPGILSLADPGIKVEQKDPHNLPKELLECSDDTKIPKDLPFLFTSRTKQKGKSFPKRFMQPYYSDNNKLTLVFKHDSSLPQRYSFNDLPFEAEISYVNSYYDMYNSDLVNQNQGGRRDLLDPTQAGLLENIDGTSFALCDNSELKVITGNDGVITSHSNYPHMELGSDYANFQCVKTLKSPSNERIRITVNNLFSESHSLINGECQEEDIHIKITDIHSQAQVNNLRICRTDGELTYEFGNEIEISFFPGSWSTPGFQFEYTALVLGVLASETSVKKVEENKKLQQEEVEQAEDLSNGYSESAESYAEPMDSNLDPFDSEFPSVAEENPEEYYQDEATPDKENTGLSRGQMGPAGSPNANSSPQSETKKLQVKQFGQYLMIATFIAVGIIIVIILIAASIVACRRSAVQERHILDLTDQLRRTEAQYTAISIDNSQNLVSQNSSHDNNSSPTDSLIKPSVVTFRNSVCDPENEKFNPDQAIIQIENAANARANKNANNNNADPLASINSLDLSKGKYILNITGDNKFAVSERIATPMTEENPIFKALGMNEYRPGSGGGSRGSRNNSSTGHSKQNTPIRNPFTSSKLKKIEAENEKLIQSSSSENNTSSETSTLEQDKIEPVMKPQSLNLNIEKSSGKKYSSLE